MNKARRKTNRRGTAKRLVSESLVLSCTRFVSSRIVRFFEHGIGSVMLRTAEKTDSFASEKISGPLLKKIGFRKSFSMPARNAVASFFSNNPFFKMIALMRNALLNTSLRTVGIFLLTFGVYASSIFALKNYVSLTLGATASIDDVSVGAICVLIGLLLTAFGEKSIMNALGNSRTVGVLLSNCLGVNDSSVERYAASASGTAIGFGFLCGSLFGITTLFFPPIRVLLFLLALLVTAAIFHIPEFGILLAAAIFSFVPTGAVATVIAVTFVSYLIKCIRLKRNFRFGSADVLVLVLAVVLAISFFASEGSLANGEYYILCFIAAYFLAKNLLCSEKLVIQTFNALCTGLSFGMALYILGDFAHLISHPYLREAAAFICASRVNADILALLTVCLLPFALSSFAKGSERKPRKWFLVLTVASAFVIDSVTFYVMIPVALFAYIATVYKAPVGALLGAAAVIPNVYFIAADYARSSAVELGAKTLYDSALNGNAGELVSVNFWGGMYSIVGAVGAVIFVLALLLILQRVFRFAITSGTKNMRLGGTVAASTVIMLAGTFLFNPFADLRSVFVIWFVLGLCGSVYSVLLKNTKGIREV